MSWRAAALVAVLATAPPAAAQQRIKPSQSGTVSQEIGATRVSIAYDRPVARGRALFGSLVKYGTPWTPGANWATTIEVSRDVLIQGRRLPRGKYSIWCIPGEQEWTVIFSRKHRVFHTNYPEGQDALRLTVRPVAATHMETLSFYFPVVDADSATLHFHWGTTVVPLSLRAPEGTAP